MESWNIDIALDNLKKLPSMEFFNEKLSETDTRSKLIDYILTEVLGWTEIDIKREERCTETNSYLDYKLSTNIPQIIIEAKKNSIDFELPTSTSQKDFVIGGILQKSKQLINAMVQARDYAVSKGVAFCVVTNGMQYIFFRSQNTFGIDWIKHKCVVFRDIEDIQNNFEYFCKLFSKSSVENGVLYKTMQFSDDVENEKNKYKTLDTRHISLPRKKDRNPLFLFIGEIVHRVFQDLATKESESEILEHCYVDSARKQDKQTPYFDHEIKSLYVSKKDAGEFQQRIYSLLRRTKPNHKEVILLIGSVGVGKSTFLQRFRKVLAKNEIDKKGMWFYINFKHFSDTGENLDNFIFNQIELILSNEYADLNIEDWTFLKQAYHSDYEKLKKGVLAPLFKSNPDKFEEKFSEVLIKSIENDKERHFVKLLTTASKRLSKSLFLVFDNADQLNPETQNKIFLAAQKLAETIECNALIAMREESYWKNRDAGPLNAFHTTAYHVQPPTLKQVLAKRFQYTKELIAGEKVEVYGDSKVTNEELLEIINRLHKTLLGTNESYINFIEAISARDIRRALDLIAAFMVSGHTNIGALLRDIRSKNPTGLIIPFHEFLNAIILKDHEVYSELNSDIMNLFGLSGGADTSNFNIIAVLGRVLHAENIRTTEIGNGYVLIEEIVNDLHAVGILPETTTSILNILNTRRLIETETTIKDSLDKSKYVRATVSGKYYIEELVKLFGYLDIVIYETPIGKNKSFKKLRRINDEIKALTGNDGESRKMRVEKRLELSSEFIGYLSDEFEKCKFRSKTDIFSSTSINLLDEIKRNFDKEKLVIIENVKEIFS